MAASDATDKEKQEADKRRQDGSKPIEVARTPYRPKLDSTYQEPEYFPENDDGIDMLFRTSGKALFKRSQALPPRTDIIWYDSQHKKELDESIQWADCPEHMRPKIRSIIKAYWDVFASEGMKRPIRAFEAYIDTGTSKPVCCPLPRYGPHESKVMTQLAQGLEDNGLIEDDDGPWGAQVVLAAKPHQGHKHWADYVWRMCVSYRKLNAV